MSIFKSIFKINNISIISPVIDQSVREEIFKFREIVRKKEEKYQEKKKEKSRQEHENTEKQLEEDFLKLQRRNSYTLTSPTFTSDELPKISTSSESDISTVVDGNCESFQSEFTEKSSKDLQNEIDKRSTATYESEASSKLTDLIEKQKREYLQIMETLKNKFTSEQHDLLMKIQTNLLVVSSTPINNSLITVTTDDEEFSEFKTCLQSQSLSLDEKTISNENDAKNKAATIINAYSRGYLTRRLIKTICVQENIRNIHETLQLVLNLNDRDIGSPVQNILYKAKLFRQLQNDLNSYGETFQFSTKEKMKLIAADREIKQKKRAEENEDQLSLSFTDVV